MIVERNDAKKQIDFCKLDSGQFFDSGGQVFVKFECVSSAGRVNALNCDKNFIMHFLPDAKVTPLNGKVVIE